MIEPRDWEELRTHGLLWLINRVVFHPRGFALALHRNEEGEISGWIMEGDGTEVWTFPNEIEDQHLSTVESFLDSLRPPARRRITVEDPTGGQPLYWTIHGEELQNLLHRVAAGEDPDMLYIEAYATADEHEYIEVEEPDDSDP